MGNHQRAKSSPDPLGQLTKFTATMNGEYQIQITNSGKDFQLYIFVIIYFVLKINDMAIILIQKLSWCLCSDIMVSTIAEKY